jgi:hypothetical protein
VRRGGKLKWWGICGFGATDSIHRDNHLQGGVTIPRATNIPFFGVLVLWPRSLGIQSPPRTMHPRAGFGPNTFILGTAGPAPTTTTHALTWFYPFPTDLTHTLPPYTPKHIIRTLCSELITLFCASGPFLTPDYCVGPASLASL